MYRQAHIDRLTREIHRTEIKLAKLQFDRDRLEAPDIERAREQVRLIRAKHANGVYLTHNDTPVRC